MAQLNGTSGDDVLIGTSSDDQISGFGGNDSLDGGAGNDLLRGNDGDDHLSGGEGNDNLRGGAGLDSFDGGPNTEEYSNVSSYGDRISFYELAATSGVVADLRTGVISNDGFGNVETMVGIESLGGDTAFVDTFYGNDTRNFLFGSRGDNLYGFGGNDEFFLSAAASIVDGGDGVDLLGLTSSGGWLTADSDGNALAETAAAATSGWDVDLAAGTLVDGYGNTGTITGIENLNGSELGDRLIGNGVANLLSGGDGNDILIGLAGDDTLHGDAGHDYVEGGAGNDSVSGGEGDDYLYGNAGDDLLDGGAGFDRVGYAAGATAGVTVDLNLQGTAQDTGQGMDTLVGIEHVSGTIFDDVITGNGGDNWLWGGSNGSGVTGNDTISAGGGNDLVSVGNGSHTVDGGSGIDTLSLYGNSTDISSAGATFSLALQGSGQDSEQGMISATGFENLVGSIHADNLGGDAGDNIIAGAEGDDLLVGAAGNDTLYGDGTIHADTHGTGRSGPIVATGDIGAAGNDILEGGEGNDTLIGGGGNDLLDGGEGSDFMAGGAGDDVYIIDQAGNETQWGDGVHENAAEGIDEVRTSLDWGLMDNVENLTATGTGNIYLGGNTLDNRLTGNSGNNYMVGEAGNDALDGGAGRDIAAFRLPAGTTGTLRVLDAGNGSFVVQLVQADDTFQDVFAVTPSGQGSATVTGLGMMAGLGTDTVTSVEDLHFYVDNWPQPIGEGQFVNVMLAFYAGTIDNGFAHVEGSVNGEVLDVNQLYPEAAPTDNINVFGNGGDDTIIGNGAFNYIRGGAGNDTIDGGGGNDSVAFALPDGMTGTLRVVAGIGSNVGKLVVERVDGATVEQLFIVSFAENGTATVQGINSAAYLGTDTVSNVRALDFLVEGGAFTNILVGGSTSGDDFLGGGGGSDAIFGGEGSDGLFGGGGDDVVFGQGGDDLYVQGGGGNDFVSGGEGHDFVTGQAGNDHIFGDAGDDYVRGDAGDDYVDGGAGYDRTGYYHTNAALGGATVSLLLQGQWQNSGIAGNDFLVSIEAVSGTPFADTLIGDDVGNWLWGSSSFYDPGTGMIQSSTNNDTISAGGGDDLVQIGAGNHTLDGGIGSDWLAYNENGSESVGATISLALQGEAQDTGLGTWTVSGFENLDGSLADDHLTGDYNANILGGGAGNDTLVGGAGDDRLLGDGGANQDTQGYAGPVTHMDDYGNVAGDDVLEGGLGHDYIDGGAGTDTASYANAGGGVTVNLGGGFAFGTDGNDTLVSIENAVGSGFNDNITGNGGSNVLDGRGGNDSIAGATGDDTLDGGDGDDFLQGDFGDNNITATGNDIIYGGNGNDGLRGGLGDDQLYGGANNDLMRGNGGVDYFDGGADDGEGFNGIGDRISFYEQRATQGVVADLRTGIISNDGFGNVETMVGIESLGGDTAYVDTFYGNDSRNFLFGSRGDNVYGFGGDDLFQISAAPAVIDGGSDTDTLFLNSFGGWLTPDTNGDGLAESMGGMGSGFVVDLATGTLADGYGNSGSVTGIENVSGTELGDSLTADANANVLDGGGGSDSLSGGEGDDLLVGGLGNDSIDGGTGMLDIAAFYLPLETLGTYSIVDGTGMDAGKKLVLLTYEGSSQVVAEVTLLGGIATVTGVGAGASIGTDTVIGVDQLVFATQQADGISVPAEAAVMGLSSGVVVDGLIAGATVFMDADGDGQWDEGEAITTTAADGTFSFLSSGSGPIVAVGGTNTDTGLPNLVTLTAPTGSSVVNPLTTLIEAVMAADGTLSAEEAAAQVANSLGISSSIDLLNVNLVAAAAAGDSEALEAQKAAAMVVTIMVAAQDATGDSGSGGDVMDSIAALVLDSEEPIVLASGETITMVLTDAVGTEAAETLSISLTETLADIIEAEDLGDLTEAQAAALTTGNDLANEIAGGIGDDSLSGLGGDDVLLGGDGNDRLNGGSGRDLLDGGAGSDTADYSASASSVSVNLMNGKMSGGDATGDSFVSIENVTGSALDDNLVGALGSNVLHGGAGADTLNGGGGADRLWGGVGADLFVFKSAADIGTLGSNDAIMDFEAGGASPGTAVDRIDLRGLDANARSANKDDAFAFIGDTAFSGKAGELRVESGGEGVSLVLGDLNGDGVADFTLTVTVGSGTLGADDFFL